MDRDAIVARCETRFQDSANNVFTAAEWADYVNDAYMDVVGAAPYWPFLESRDTATSLSAGTNTATLPADVWRVSAVYNATDDLLLEPIAGRRDYREWFPDTVGSGMPTHYRLRGRTLEVYPVPAATTALHIDTFVPPAVLGATDEPIFPEQYHRILVSGALAYAYDDDGNFNAAQIHRGRFEAGVMAMKDDLLSPRTDFYPTIQDV